MLHIVHHPDYVVRSGDGTHQFSKYGAVMASLRAEGALVEHRPEPMPREWLERAHDPSYVEQVLTCTVPPEIERRIGFAVTPAVSRRAQLSPGGTWLACMTALEHGYAANAGGGSHHALPGSGAGFCVFNDLAIAALRLIDERAVSHILIVDCDVHQGDGTAAILAGHPEITTFSIHAEKNFPVRKSRSTLDIGLADGTGDDAYLAALRLALASLIGDAAPDLLLYQAGVDVHVDDRLGRLALTDKGIEARDSLVADAARSAGIPLASAMGGGYGPDVVTIGLRHARTMRNLEHAYFG